MITTVTFDLPAAMLEAGNGKVLKFWEKLLLN